MECNKDDMGIINIKKFNDSINKYNDETKGEFQEFFSTCNTKNSVIKDGNIKGGASRNTKLNKYFFLIIGLIQNLNTQISLKLKNACCCSTPKILTNNHSG